MQNAKALLRKGCRLNDKVRIIDGTKIPVGDLERFEAGGELTPKQMDALASYLFTGHKRYDAASDLLVSMNMAEPLPLGISLPQTEVDAAIQSREFHGSSGGFKRIK